MKMLYVLPLTVSLLALASGCAYDREDKLYPAASKPACDTAATTYSNDVSHIIGTNCAISGCHVAGAQVPDLSDYNKVFAQKDRIKVRAIDEQSMPPLTQPRLASCDHQKLAAWLGKGAQNN